MCIVDFDVYNYGYGSSRIICCNFISYSIGATAKHDSQ